VQRKLPGKIRFNSSARQLTDIEIEKLLQKGAIKWACFHSKQFLSNLFTVPKKGGELRPVINLKPLNESVKYHHFKMESLNHLLDCLQVGNL
jgi:hypothetical protein